MVPSVHQHQSRVKTILLRKQQEDTKNGAFLTVAKAAQSLLSPAPPQRKKRPTTNATSYKTQGNKLNITTCTSP
jgi:hypothetical protein